MSDMTVPSDPIERFRHAWKGVFEVDSPAPQPAPSDAIARFRRAGGKFFVGVDADAYIRELRDEWER